MSIRCDEYKFDELRNTFGSKICIQGKCLIKLYFLIVVIIPRAGIDARGYYSIIVYYFNLNFLVIWYNCGSGAKIVPVIFL